ncbi:hypothetical protein [Thermobifida cellulosilytica]|uniref:hypothetical protein n=1 Tax=Thermobifida cellulosilytica TaxID=144786 RepID=UPI000B153DDF|nr:hypothetical protein [Thermobifida cellulosilytica]
MRNSTTAALLGGLAALAAVPPAAVATPAAEETDTARNGGIALSVTDSRDRLAVGEDTAYTVTVRNEREEAVTDLLVAQTAPALDLHEADGGGVVEGSTAVWLVTLDPGQETARTVTATLTEPPDQDSVSTTVCAGWPDDPGPVVCADHGTAVAARTGVPLRPLLTGVALAAAISLLAGLAVLLRRRTRRPRRRYTARHAIRRGDRRAGATAPERPRAAVW